MKFEKQLAAKITPEWRKQYINYKEMKEILHKATKEAPSPESSSPDMVNQYFTSFDQVFFALCEEELMKINSFYSDQLAKANTRFETLQNALKSTIQTYETEINLKDESTSKSCIPPKYLKRLKLAFSEFYYLLTLLQNYRNLNHTGFAKILNKHDILLSVESGSAWRVEHVERAYFYSSRQVEKLIQDTEATVTDVLCGDRRRAMELLKVPGDEEGRGFWLAFRVGMFSGCFVVLSIAVIFSVLSYNGPENLQTVFKLYRGPLLTIQLLFLFGINIYGWRIAGVNYVLLFELDPRRHLNEKHIVEIALMLGVVWNLSLLGFLYSPSLGMPPYVHPLGFFVFLLLFMVNPVDIFYRRTRFWFMNIAFRVLTAPITYVNCPDFLLGDQLISFVTPFLDYHFLICFYASNNSWWTASDTSYCTKGCLVTRTIVSLLPGWFRFAQCMRRYRDTKAVVPHLANAGKYFTIIMAWIMAGLREGFEDKTQNVWEGSWLWIWFTSNFIMATYCFFWDIKMDSGLWDCGAKENKLFRDELIYPSTSLYYLFMIEDFVLRYIWIVSFVLSENGIVAGELLTSVMAPIEIFRRFIWNFFRMEYEHLNNLRKLRAVRDIKVKTPRKTPKDINQVQISCIATEENRSNRESRQEAQTNFVV